MGTEGSGGCKGLPCLANCMGPPCNGARSQEGVWTGTLSLCAGTLSPRHGDPLPRRGWLLLTQRPANPTLKSCGANEAGNPLINNRL